MKECMVLKKLRDERQTVTVFTTNGYQMKGRIAGFDKYMLALDIGGAQSLIFKSAVSTIQPETPVDLGPTYCED